MGITWQNQNQYRNRKDKNSNGALKVNDIKAPDTDRLAFHFGRKTWRKVLKLKNKYAIKKTDKFSA